MGTDVAGARPSHPIARARARVVVLLSGGRDSSWSPSACPRARAPTGAEAGRAGERVASAERGRGRRRERRARGGRRETSVGRSVVVASARETRRRGFIRAFIRSRGGRLNFERARGGARRDVEDARESARERRERERRERRRLETGGGGRCRRARARWWRRGDARRGATRRRRRDRVDETRARERARGRG